MKTVELAGRKVSALCLGTMTWGTQTDEAGAHAQIARAAEAGVNFMDTAEMYPTNPARAETAGRTEEIIGNWMGRYGRGDWVIATKISGAGSLVRDGAEITPAAIRACCEASLRRLRVDHIDLYQFHWPNRGSYHFRKSWHFDPSQIDRDRVIEDMSGCLEELARLQSEGKIGAFGLSNETAWGMAQWLRLADQGLGPRAVALQNEYSLMCRLYDTDLAELGAAENVTLLAYSPLAAGLLTGKYQGGKIPEGSRRSATPELGGRVTDRADAAVAAYLKIAADAGLDPAAMANAWILTRPFPVVSIIGASTMPQLETAFSAARLEVSAEVLAAIEVAHKAHPMPF